MAGRMAKTLLAATVMFAGVVLVILLALGLYRHFFKVRRRALASALVGELVGILRIIETSKIEARLHEVAGKRRSGRAKPKSFISPLPQPAIFVANANRLELFDPPLARKIANVYTLLKGVTDSLPMVASDTEQSDAVLIQLQECLSLADDVFRRLRPLL